MLKTRLALLVAVSALVLTAACDDNFVDPFANEGRYYSVYGHLDLIESDHVVRVIPVTRRSGIIEHPTDPAASIDATVTTTNLTTGETVQWIHVLQRLSDGTYGHIYRANFIVQQGNTYRLDVTRSDGAQAWAVTTVPVLREDLRIERGPVEFSADSTVLRQRLVIPNVPTPWNIEASYLWGGGLVNQRLYVPYGRPGERTEDGGWAFTLEITEDQELVRQDVQLAISQARIGPNQIVQLKAMGLRVRILDANWDPPGGIFDPVELIQPGALSNVENGYGFFGSVGLYAEEWNTCELSEPLGYSPVPPGC